jgi:pimeloyl-ACP methyl ester carboxylesterase
MPKARVGDIDTWYGRSGGDGPVLILTHGFAGPTIGWEPIINEFKSHFDLVLYDVRAHGNTGMPRDPSTVTLPQFAADIAGLMDALAIPRAHIAGVSMGGMISAQFACDFPDRAISVALCDTTAGNRSGSDAAATGGEQFLVDALGQMLRVVEKYGLRGLVERENRYRREGDTYAHLQALSLEQQDAKNARQKIDAMTPEGYIASARAMIERPDLTSRTPKLTMPVQVSCGEWDAFYRCALRDHALIPNSRLVTVRGAAHATPDYKPQLWKRAIFDFIADVEAGRNVAGEFELS